ncbi:Unknown protein sequence [Pseudomonas amygdali pv. lachrymans]|uniref:Uncharacterized protein n=1 Tax=Pseudomonas amygdali pv. lachrymans TaxID=53707 RepID=A0ABR5KSB1_PSEAV|nr:Unknown protein sequence [Pseudomonas amygdali pv. lachrymans]
MMEMSRVAIKAPKEPATTATQSVTEALLDWFIVLLPPG